MGGPIWLGGTNYTRYKTKDELEVCTDARLRTVSGPMATRLSRGGIGRSGIGIGGARKLQLGEKQWQKPLALPVR